MVRQMRRHQLPLRSMLAVSALTAGILVSVAPSAAAEFAAGPIFYSVDTGDDSAFNIMRINPDGTGRTLVMPGASDPSVNRAQTKMVHLRTVSGGRLWISNIDGSGAQALTATGAMPSLSPSGDCVAYMSNDGQIRMLNVFGNRCASPGPVGEDPAFSPDGTRIAFTERADGLTAQIAVMNADGTGFKRLTSGSGQREQPDWSPDGSKIVFKDESGGISWIHVGFPATAHKVVNQALGNFLTWSPDSRRVAFVRTPFGGPQTLWTVRLDGGDLRQIETGLTQQFSPDWGYPPV